MRLADLSLCAILVTLPLSSAYAQNMAPNTVTVRGGGQVLVTPDYATVDLGVISSAKTVAAAMQANNAAMNRVIKAVAGLGIVEKDIQTSRFSVEALHPRKDGEPDESVTIGYQVANKVTVTVNDMSKLAQVIDAATQAGANSASSVDFGVRNSASAEDAAKTRAMQDARHQAEILVAAEGAKIDKMIAVSTVINPYDFEGGIPPPAMEVLPQSTPILPGQITIRATVTVQYRLQ